MSRAEDINRKLDNATAKRDEATGIHRECNDIQQTLEDSLSTIRQTFAPLANFQSENRDELELLVQCNEMLKYSKEQSQQALDDIRAVAEIQKEKNKVELDAKKAELKEKVKLLSIVKKERVCVAATLKEKQTRYDQMQEVLQAEQAKQNENRETLMKLVQETESKEKMSRLNYLQAKSARKDEEIRKLAAENEGIRKNIARISEESASREVKRVAKLEEASKLQSKVDEYKAIYKKLEAKNQKIAKKNASKTQKIMDEIASLEQAVTEKRATQESQLKTNAELTYQVNTVIGDCGTTEQKMSELRTELEQLNEECSQLSDKIQVAGETKILNENKLEKLKALQETKAKLSKELDNRAPNEDQEFKLPVTRSRRNPPTREQTPVESKNPRASRKGKRHLPPKQVVPEVVPEQDIRNSPDSSDSWADVSSIPTDVLNSETRRHAHTMELFQKFFTEKR